MGSHDPLAVPTQLAHHPAPPAPPPADLPTDHHMRIWTYAVLGLLTEHEITARPGGRFAHEAHKAFRVLTIMVFAVLAVRSCVHTVMVMRMGEHADDPRKPMHLR